jgi:hypothetical protein
MKERRREHMEARLTEAEGELRALLEKVLPRTAQSGEQLFFHSENLPNGYRANMLPVESEQLFSLARECVELHEQLQRPLGGSVAQLYLFACHEAASLHNQHRRGPRKLSAWLLAQMGRS